MTPAAEIERVVAGEHPDPHSVLGAHRDAGGVVVRVFRPARRIGARAAAAGRARRARAGPPGRRLRGRAGAQAHAPALPPGGRLSGRSRRSRCAIRTRSCPRSETSISTSSPRAATSGCGTRSARIPATIDGAPGTAFAVWAPGARAVGVVGDFNAWNERAHPMRTLGSAGVWELFVPEAAAGARLQVRDPRRRRRRPPQGRSARAARGAAAQDRLRHLRAGSPLGRRRLAGAAARERAARGADVDLRGAPRLVAPQPARGQPLADLPRAGRRARRLRARARLHARRAHAGDGAPVRRLVGLPGHRLLRADVALRHARRLPRLRRPAARARPRRDPRLGAGALPARRVRARALRRHGALRARGSRAAASIPTGARSSSTTAATRCATS